MGRSPAEASSSRSPSSSSSSDPYPEELQLKLYQAFIFSIPILFSIILFLLFYLFYLKRRAAVLSSPPQMPPSLRRRPSSSQQSPPSTPPPPPPTTAAPSFPRSVGFKGELIKDKLLVVRFDEDLNAKDSQCCVCLGDFEMGESLRQLPSCKHVFHSDCIRLWLYANATCPLCRHPVVISIIKLHLAAGNTNDNSTSL